MTLETLLAVAAVLGFLAVAWLWRVQRRHERFIRRLTDGTHTDPQSDAEPFTEPDAHADADARLEPGQR